MKDLPGYIPESLLKNKNYISILDVSKSIITYFKSEDEQAAPISHIKLRSEFIPTLDGSQIESPCFERRLIEDIKSLPLD